MRIRRLNLSRGGREGNNALTKDLDYQAKDDYSSDLPARMFEWGASVATVTEALAQELFRKHTITEALVQGVR